MQGEDTILKVHSGGGFPGGSEVKSTLRGVPWWSRLGFGAFTAMAKVQTLIWNLKSHKLHSLAKKKKKSENKQKNKK